MAELVDAPDLGSGAERRGGSSPFIRTNQQALDTITPSGKAMFGMMAVFAEFERAMIVERMNAGLARAKAQGKRLGRPGHGEAMEAKVRELRATGMGVVEVAKTLGIGVSAVQRIDKASVTA